LPFNALIDRDSEFAHPAMSLSSGAGTAGTSSIVDLGEVKIGYITFRS
jgi:hypothetical protein